MINDCIWTDPLREDKLKIIIGYSSYLTQKFFAVRLDSNNASQIVEAFSSPEVGTP